MSDKPYLLAIDNGTQSVRALLFDLQGNLLGKGKVELEAYISTQPGWAEQDPEYYWRSLGEACQQLRLGVDEVQPDQAPRVGEQLAQLGHGDVVSFLHAVAPGSALHHAHGDSIPPVRPDRSTSVCRRRKVRTYPAKALDEA